MSSAGLRLSSDCELESQTPGLSKFEGFRKWGYRFLGFLTIRIILFGYIKGSPPRPLYLGKCPFGMILAFVFASHLRRALTVLNNHLLHHTFMAALESRV